MNFVSPAESYNDHGGFLFLQLTIGHFPPFQSSESCAGKAKKVMYIKLDKLPEATETAATVDASNRFPECYGSVVVLNIDHRLSRRCGSFETASAVCILKRESVTYRHRNHMAFFTADSEPRVPAPVVRRRTSTAPRRAGTASD